MSDLQRLAMRLAEKITDQDGKTYLEMLGAPDPSGKGTSSLKIFAKVALRFLPLKGVVPNSIS